jgi:hypothetical protein
MKSLYKADSGVRSLVEPHKTITMFLGVELLAWRYACLWKLPLKSVEHTERRGRRRKIYGWCYKEDGRLGIALQGVSPDELVDTIAHELAHLLHRRHSGKWRKLYETIHERMQDDDCADFLCLTSRLIETEDF